MFEDNVTAIRKWNDAIHIHYLAIIVMTSTPETAVQVLIWRHRTPQWQARLRGNTACTIMMGRDYRVWRQVRTLPAFTMVLRLGKQKRHRSCFRGYAVSVREFHTRFFTAYVW